MEEEKKLSSAWDHPQKLASTILSPTCQQLPREHPMLLTINSAASVVTWTQNTWQVPLLSFSPAVWSCCWPVSFLQLSASLAKQVGVFVPWRLPWFLSRRGRNWSKTNAALPRLPETQIALHFFHQPCIPATLFSIHIFLLCQIWINTSLSLFKGIFYTKIIFC